MLVWILACAVISACSLHRVKVASEVHQVSEADLSQRVELGHLGAYGELDDGEVRARSAARLAAELGNTDEAAAFAREQLDLARTRLLIVRLEAAPDASQDAAFESALERLDEAARFAVEIGDDILDGRLVLEAAQFLIKPKQARRAMSRALAITHEADLSWGYARLWQVFEKDASALAALQRLRWRSHRAPGLPYQAPRLAPEALAAAGPEAVDLLWTEADRAASEGRQADYGRWLDALLEADPWDPDALAGRVVLDAVDRGALALDPNLLPDLATDGAAPLGSRARMHLRQRRSPDSVALALARANMMLAMGTFGDAGQLLSELDLDSKHGDEHSSATPRERDLHAQLVAITALESGTEAGRRAYEVWQRRARAKRSAALTAWLSDFEQDQAPAGHVELARAADRIQVTGAKGRITPRLPLPVLGSASIDRSSTARTRARAHAGVAGRDPNLGAKLSICRERKLFDQDCRDALDELAKLDVANEAYGAGLDALAGSPNARSEWFSPVPWLEGEQLPAVRERLLEYEGTRVAATTHYQAAALFSELAANRPDLARERLDRYAKILRPETRAIATMALHDLEDGLVEPRSLPNLLLEIPSADVDASWFLERWLPGDPSMVDELFPGRSRLARFARGLALARMGAWREATAELLVAVEEVEGPAKGMVAGRLALAAQLANEPVLRDRALAIAEAEEPRGFMAPYVRARVAEAALDMSSAHDLYLEALARRPRALPAFEGALRTLEIRARELTRVRDALLLFPDSGEHWQSSELLDAAARDELDGLLLTNLWLARNDPATLLAIGAPAAQIGALAEQGLYRLLAELESHPLPADAFPIAAKVLAWLGTAPPRLRVEHRNTELWLTYLIGRDSELAALAEAQPRYDAFTQPASGTHSTLLLADARRRHAVDDLLSWTIVRAELWDADDPATRSILGDLYGEIEDPALAQYACLRMFQRDEFEVAAQRCVPLWNRLGGSPFLAVDFAYLALNDPDLLRSHGLDLGEFFDTAAGLPGLSDDPVWLLNASLWASKQGDDEHGATLRLDQLALEAIASEADDLELGQGRYRGEVLRQQIIDGFDPADRRQFAVAAGSAVRSLDLVAADIYAHRLLAWLPSLDEDGVPEFTARSPQLLAATRREGDTSDAELRSMAHYALGMSALIADDLGTGRVTKASMYEVLDTYAEGGNQALAALERLATDQPEGHVIKLMLMSAYADGRMREQAVGLARELVELHPDSPLVLAEALPLLTGVDDLAAARQLLARGRAEHPDHPWLRDESLPAVLTGAEDALPSWLRAPDTFAARLDRIDDATLDSLAPVRHVNLETAAEAFFAATGEANAEGLGAHEPIPGAADLGSPSGDAGGDEAPTSRLQFVVREPRASRCEGLGCAEPLIADWSSRNYSLLWTRELELPSGPAVEFVVTDGELVINNVLVPTGGNLFVLISATTPGDIDAFMPQVRLLRDSFRPLDWVLGADEAEALRSAGRAPPADPLRLRGRRLLAAVPVTATATATATPKAPPTCPLDADPELRGLDEGAKAELLVDLFLGTRAPAQRRALLACTKPEAPAAARLALLSLLDGDAAVFAFGRAATTIHHQAVLTDTRRLLYQDRQMPGSDPALTAAGDQPPFGLLQVIAALPDEHSRALTRELLSRRDPRLRALALAASATMDYFGTLGSPVEAKPRTEVERLREVVRAGEAKDALLAVRSLMDVPGEDNLAALRARADALIEAGVADESSRGLAVDLAWALARRLDIKDRKRLVKLAEAIDLDPPDGHPRRAEGVKKGLESVREDYDEARARLRDSSPAIDSERVNAWVRFNRARPAPRTREQVAAAPLAELVPGQAWTYVRVADAGLFSTSLEGLLRRLAPANPADAYLVRALIHDTVLGGSFSLLSESGGLDPSKPIECVSPKGAETFACSATIRDRDAVLSTLAARELGDDAGVAIPLSLATTFAALPIDLGALPFALHGLMDTDEDDLAQNPAAEITAERLRLTRTIAGHELEYYATVELHENRMIVDSEHYLVLGDRLLVFSGADVAEQLLREVPTGARSLAASPEFRGALARFRDGAALQAVDFSEDLGLPELALELVFDNGGIEFAARARGDHKAIGDYGRLTELLPQDPNSPTAHAAVAVSPDALRDYFESSELERCAGFGSGPPTLAPSGAPSGEPSGEPSGDPSGDLAGPKPRTCQLSDGDRFPPVALAESAAAAVLAWYPEVGSELWQDWVLALPFDPKLRKAMKRLGLPEPKREGQDARVLNHAGLWWLVKDGALLVASTEALATAALAHTPAAPGPGLDADAKARDFAHFSLDGQRAAVVLRELAQRHEGERRGDYLRVVATMIGLVGQVEMRGSWTEPGSDEAILSARIPLNLAESEEELALIDRWLANPEVSNAAKLPRRVSQDEATRGLRYRIRVHDAEAFARSAIPSDNPRMRVEVLSPDELSLEVLPSRAVPSATHQVLTADERTRMLESDSLTRANDPKIREIANKLRITGDDGATVEAIVAWVHDEIHYEITPTSLDAVAILDRGEGDCTEYALLTVTLLRAAGVPARLQEGMAAGGEEMVAHAWVAWHDGKRWHEVDPTAGTAWVGSGHLEIEVVDVLALISLGQFEVTAVESLD